MLRSLAAAAAVSFAAIACRSTPPSDAASRDYVLAILRSGSNTSATAEQRQEAMRGHMANIQRLADEGVLWIAGPFGQPNPDPTRRGLFLFAIDDVARAGELTASDPAVKAGLLAPELIAVRSSADFERAKKADTDFVAANRAAGKEPGADFAMHTYTFGFVGGGERAAAALECAVANGDVIAVGRCGGAREGTSIVWIDAADVATAETKLAGVRGELGDVDLAPWWGSASLVELAHK